MKFLIPLGLLSILSLVINVSNATDIWSPEDEKKFIEEAGCGKLCCGKNLNYCKKKYPGTNKTEQCQKSVSEQGRLLERGACTHYGYKPYTPPVRKKKEKQGFQIFLFLCLKISLLKDKISHPGDSVGFGELRLIDLRENSSRPKIYFSFLGNDIIPKQSLGFQFCR